MSLSSWLSLLQCRSAFSGCLVTLSNVRLWHMRLYARGKLSFASTSSVSLPCLSISPCGCLLLPGFVLYENEHSTKFTAPLCVLHRTENTDFIVTSNRFPSKTMFDVQNWSVILKEKGQLHVRRSTVAHTRRVQTYSMVLLNTTWNNYSSIDERLSERRGQSVDRGDEVHRTAHNRPLVFSYLTSAAYLLLPSSVSSSSFSSSSLSMNGEVDSPSRKAMKAATATVAGSLWRLARLVCRPQPLCRLPAANSADSRWLSQLTCLTVCQAMPSMSICWGCREKLRAFGEVRDLWSNVGVNNVR